jgi:hypothetical protein
MGILKGMKDMKDMVSAAPGLIESANQMGEMARAQAAANQAQAAAGLGSPIAASEPLPGNLEPIAGVTLERYTSVIKGIAAYGNNQDMLPQVALSLGVSPDDWKAAQDGWGARIQSDRAIGTRFNALYTAN